MEVDYVCDEREWAGDAPRLVLFASMHNIFRYGG